MKRGFVYIMTNHSRTLYTGVTSDLQQRVLQHKTGAGSEFSSSYRTTQLVYFEEFSSMRDAIAREKQLKGWRREKKVTLVEKDNAGWVDLAAHLDPYVPGSSS